jgi:hypothetical protein
MESQAPWWFIGDDPLGLHPKPTRTERLPAPNAAANARHVMKIWIKEPAVQRVARVPRGKQAAKCRSRDTTWRFFALQGTPLRELLKKTASLTSRPYGMRG